MYKITKKIEIAGSHNLELPYDSPCQRIHGHNWIITVEVISKVLLPSGMIIDFSKISKTVKQLDHRNLNEILPKGINPTAENIAHWIAQEVQKEINKEEANYLSAPNKMPPEEALPKVSKVTVQESEGNIACYTP